MDSVMDSIPSPFIGMQTLESMEAGVAAWRRSVERLMQGFAEITAHEVAFGQCLLFDGVEELERLSRVRGADEFFSVSLALSGERIERFNSALRDLAENVQKSALNAFSLADEEIKATTATKAPPRAKAARA